MDQLISFGEEKNMRTPNVLFVVVSCESIYNDIFGKSFLATLCIIASTVHLKMKYHNDSSQPILDKVNLHGTRPIHEATLKNYLESAITHEERKNAVDEVTNVVDLDVREDKVLQDDGLNISIRSKMKTLRLISDGKFEVVQLDDNLTWPVRIDTDLHTRVKKGLVECLKANADFFMISCCKMSDIDPIVACHKLNINPCARYVSQQKRRQSIVKAEATMKMF